MTHREPNLASSPPADGSGLQSAELKWIRDLIREGSEQLDRGDTEEAEAVFRRLEEKFQSAE